MAKSGWTGDPSRLLRVGKRFDLARVDAGATPGFAGGKRDAVAVLSESSPVLRDLQERLFAEGLFGGSRSVLLVLQGIDTAGKGGIVSHALAGVNPQGIQAHSFAAPSRAELRHNDFLWRIRRELPAPGHIGVFDRSHYEDVIVHRVRGLSTPEVVEERYSLIAAFEAELASSGTTVVKAMLQISPDEQKKRLRQRLDRPEKNWKYRPRDLDDRALWPAFQEAYQIAIERTSTPDAPWFVIPADHKYYARIAVQRLLIDRMTALNLGWPKATYDVNAEKKRLTKSSV